jgi:hypothetical protein
MSTRLIGTKFKQTALDYCLRDIIFTRIAAQQIEEEFPCTILLLSVCFVSF